MPAIVTGVLNIGIQYFVMLAKSHEDVSLVTPISASTPAVVIVTSLLILGEKTSNVGWFGIMLLVIGTYVLNIQAYIDQRKKSERPRLRDWLAPFLLITKSRGVRYAFIGVLLSTVSLNYDALVSRRANPFFGVTVIFGIVSIFNFLLWYVKERSATSTVDHRPIASSLLLAIVIAGVIAALANGITNYAFRYAIVPYVGTLKRLQIPLTIILAYWLL